MAPIMDIFTNFDMIKTTMTIITYIERKELMWLKNVHQISCIFPYSTRSLYSGDYFKKAMLINQDNNTFITIYICR